MTEEPQRPPDRHHQAASKRQACLPPIVTKKELASLLRVSTRQIEYWQAAKIIPVIRIGRRCVRYSSERVVEALVQYEISETRVKQQ